MTPKKIAVIIEQKKNSRKKENPLANETFFDIIKVWWGELAYTHDFLINTKKKMNISPSLPLKNELL